MAPPSRLGGGGFGGDGFGGGLELCALMVARRACKQFIQHAIEPLSIWLEF